jgi:DNA-binding PucR family transcriptional regulator
VRPLGGEQLDDLRRIVEIGRVLRHAAPEEIVRTAVDSVPELSACRAHGVSLRDAPQEDGPVELRAALAALGDTEGPVPLPGEAWGWAFPLTGVEDCRGHLLVGADEEPPEQEVFRLRVLAEHAGAALATAQLVREHRQQAAELREVDDLLAQTTEALCDSLQKLERQTAIRERLSRVPASGDREVGIVSAVHELTGLPVMAEDRFGNLLAAAGPVPDTTGRSTPRHRDELLDRALRAGQPVRDRGRLVAVAQPRDGVVGVLALVDPEERAGPSDVLALEQGAMMLAIELAHRSGLAEAEQRLGQDLVDDILTGSDVERVAVRAAALGADLHRPHRVVAVRGLAGVTVDEIADAVAAAARALDAGPLVGRRNGLGVLLAHRPLLWPRSGRWNRLHAAITRHLGSPAVALGIGLGCEGPADFPRSWEQAQRALAIRCRSRAPEGITAYEDLGLYRVLNAGDPEVEAFVDEWLGALLAYDEQHRTDLVSTLAAYLDCGGSYDETAAALAVHRSTLRYRLQRIREVSGHDLADAEQRLNLHVATRAWSMGTGGTTAPR